MALVYAVTFLAAVAVYSNSLDGEFVLDDNPAIYEARVPVGCVTCRAAPLGTCIKLCSIHACLKKHHLLLGCCWIPLLLQ